MSEELPSLRSLYSSLNLAAQSTLYNQAGAEVGTPPVPAAASGTNESSAGDSAATAQMQMFQQILSTMMMAFSMSGSSTGSSSSSSGFGFNIGSMMAPLMFSLFEQMLSPQTTTTTTNPSSAVVNAYRTSQETSDQSIPKGLPVVGRLSQEYHAGHIGLDFAVPVGTEIKSTMSGKVVYAGWNNQGYGNLVIVENGSYRTYYAHLSEIPVSMGQQVRAGQVIGLSGNTGNSTGPHLHYEIRFNGKAIDPTGVTLGAEQY